MTKTEIGWLAGIMDGEGSIGLYRRKIPGYRDIFLVGLVVANTKKIIVDKVFELVGVGDMRKRRSHNPKHKDAYVWQVFSASTAKVLNGLCQHLVGKKEQCELASEAVQLSTRGRYNPNHRRLSQIHRRMRTLNKKGN
jgi:hypothetical protein